MKPKLMITKGDKDGKHNYERLEEDKLYDIEADGYNRACKAYDEHMPTEEELLFIIRDILKKTQPQLDSVSLSVEIKLRDLKEMAKAIYKRLMESER